MKTKKQHKRSNVCFCVIPGKKSLVKATISISPSRITAAFVLSPYFMPSVKPAPNATTFYKQQPLHISTAVTPAHYSAHDIQSSRALIDQPISRESSGDPNLIGDRAAHPVCDH